ncbi:MAG: hypothetical protein U9Q16_02940 [Patescibacteria group bacterium]|nr:hypothetical protein [Patescibacteria group bacterium]
MNRQFKVNGIEGIETHIEILNETEGGYETRVTSTAATGIRESFEFITDELLESCLRTGYIVAVEVPAYVHAALTA